MKSFSNGTRDLSGTDFGVLFESAGGLVAATRGEPLQRRKQLVCVRLNQDDGEASIHRTLTPFTWMLSFSLIKSFSNSPRDLSGTDFSVLFESAGGLVTATRGKPLQRREKLSHVKTGWRW